MSEKLLVTNGSIETASAFETLADELKRVITDPYRWKWAILAMHSGLQGMMVLALQSSHGLHVLKAEDATRWLEAHEKSDPYPADLKLDDFLSLYKKIKSDVMLMYLNSRKFKPAGTQGSSIKFLNRLRNEFIHFTPRIWALELEGLPVILSESIDVAEFLAWQSSNIFWSEPELENRVRAAFKSARTSLTALEKKYKAS